MLTVRSVCFCLLLLYGCAAEDALGTTSLHNGTVTQGPQDTACEGESFSEDKLRLTVASLLRGTKFTTKQLNASRGPTPEDGKIYLLTLADGNKLIYREPKDAFSRRYIYEVLTYHFDRDILKFGLVPPSLMVAGDENSERKGRLYMQYVQGVSGAFSSDEYFEIDVIEAAVFDCLIGSNHRDRDGHDANWIAYRSSSGGTRLALIDNIFDPQMCEGKMVSLAQRKKFSLTDRAAERLSELAKDASKVLAAWLEEFTGMKEYDYTAAAKKQAACFIGAKARTILQHNGFDFDIKTARIEWENECIQPKL